MRQGGNHPSMTNIERFQKLQIELVRAGFGTEFHAEPNGDKATLAMYIDLKKQKAADVEKLDTLTSGHGFSYVIEEDSRAAITLAPADR